MFGLWCFLLIKCKAFNVASEKQKEDGAECCCCCCCWGVRVGGAGGRQGGGRHSSWYPLHSVCTCLLSVMESPCPSSSQSFLSVKNSLPCIYTASNIYVHFPESLIEMKSFECVCVCVFTPVFQSYLEPFLTTFSLSVKTGTGIRTHNHNMRFLSPGLRFRVRIFKQNKYRGWGEEEQIPSLSLFCLCACTWVCVNPAQ